MTSFFFETPWILGSLCALGLVVVWYSWLRTGQQLALYFAAGVTALAAALIALNLIIVTDRESVTETLQDAIKLVQANKFDDLQRYVEENNSASLQAARLLLKSMRIDEARITRIHAIDVEEVSGEKVAQVRLNVYVKGEYSNYMFNTPRWVLLDLVENPVAAGSTDSSLPRWLVTHVEHREPHYEFLGQ